MRATVIIVCSVQQVNGNQFLTYHNIDLQEDLTPNKKFIDFARRFPGVTHMNLYDPKRPKKKNFIHQLRYDSTTGLFNVVTKA